MSRSFNIVLTGLAPAIWGTTYVVTSELLPQGFPLTTAALRALPAGLILLCWVRQLPFGAWWWKSLVLGGLNFTVFWALLFVSAYRLPGGVAATVGAIQPLIVILIAHFVLARPVKMWGILSGVVGVFGVALMVLTSAATLDPVGIAAGLGGAVSMALGTVLSRKWMPPVPPLTFTSWQLTAGGLILVPLALTLEPVMPFPDLRNIAGFVWLGLIGGAFTYLLWFRGLARLEPSAVSALGFLSPVVAVLAGWLVLGQALGTAQILGMAVVFVSVWIAQWS